VHKTHRKRSVDLEEYNWKRIFMPLHIEFLQICKAVAVGFAVMGFIGYFVKLIHIPMCVTIFFIVEPLFSDIPILRNNILVYVLQIVVF